MSQPSPIHSAADLKDNFDRVQERVDAAAQAVGRDSSEVSILPVSKTVPSEKVAWAAELGWTLLGENKVQEAYRKWQALTLEDGLDLAWAIIGPLQTNKANRVAEFATQFQALDSLRLANHLSPRVERAGRTLDVFIQVNTSGEDAKHGFSVDEAREHAAEISALPGLNVVGLMTMAMFSDDEALVRGCFAQLRELRDDLNAQGLQDIKELSMGMSADMEWAIAEGATIIRVGEAIFGPRNYPAR